MRWLVARTKKQSASQRRYFRPELMRLEDREVLSTTPGVTVELQSLLPAVTNSIVAFENNFHAILTNFTTQLNSLNQELNLLQNENNLLWQTVQQLEHSLLSVAPPSAPPASPPQSLSSFAGTYSATQIPTTLQGDIPANTPQYVSFTVNSDGSGVLAVSPFDGTTLTLHFNAGSISYNNGTIGFTYPSGLVSYIQFSFTPGDGHQLSGSIVAHGDWGQGGSYVAFSFPDITLT
ncbi:MAG: hypothetical protein ACRELG_22155 [Gemmataceae bacterium]